MYLISCSPDGLYHARLPIAPGLNAKYVNGQFQVSREFQDFKDDVEKLWRTTKNINPIPKLYLKSSEREFDKNVCIAIHVYEKNNRRDIDATEKVVQDVLQDKFYVDDRQIWCKRTLQYVNEKNPYIDVYVFESSRKLDGFIPDILAKPVD